MPIYVRRVIWSLGAEDHIWRHKVTRDEAEDIFFGDHHAQRLQDDLYRLIGQTSEGRYLTIFASPRSSNDYYVVTARDSSDAERRLLRRARGGR